VFSDAIELLGLACLVAGVFVLLGLGAALLAAGGCLLIVGAGVDDVAVFAALARAGARVRHAAGAPARRLRARSAKARTA
jgi:hypothetical protein